MPAPASASALAAVLAALRELTPATGGWVARAVVRDAALNSLGRTAATAVDGALAAVGGRAVDGASVHRSTHPTTRALHYWFEEAGRGGASGGGGGTTSNGAPPTPRAAPRRGAPPPTPPPAKKGAGGDAKRKGVANGGGPPPPSKKGKAATKPAAEPPPTKPPRGSRELASLHADAAGEVLLLPPGARRARGPGVAAAPPTTATGAAPRPPPPWVAYTPGAGVPPGGDAAGQLLRDVACLYDALLRPVPLGAPATTTKPTPGAAALASLAAAVRVLSDTRHFAKDYGGQLAAKPAAGAAPPKDARDRWLISASFSDPLPGVGSKGRARRTAPPPLPLLARKGAAVAGLKDAARRELASVYRLFAPPATVTAVVKGEVGAAGGGGGSGSASTSPPSAKPLTAILAAADPDPRWRHAGGVEDWAVACACGVRDDDGARMVTCRACGRWVHTRCEGVADTETPPAGLVCVTCCANGVA